MCGCKVKFGVPAARSVCERLEEVPGNSEWEAQVRLGSTQSFPGVGFNRSQWQYLKYNPDVETWVELVGFYIAPSFPESEPYLVFFFFIFKVY